MAGPVSTWKINYHFEGPKAGTTANISGEYSDYISASAADYDTVKAILSSNSRLLGGGTLVIDAVQPCGPSGVLT